MRRKTQPATRPAPTYISPERNIDQLSEEIQGAIVFAYPRDHLTITLGDRLQVVETDNLAFLKAKGFPIGHLPKKSTVYVGIRIPWRWGAQRIMGALK